MNQIPNQFRRVHDRSCLCPRSRREQKARLGGLVFRLAAPCSQLYSLVSKQAKNPTSLARRKIRPVEEGDPARDARLDQQLP